MTSGRMTMAGTLWRCVACRFHHWLRAAALLSGLAFSSAVLADSAGESRDCKLAPGDRITVSVVGQAELSGDILNAQTATTKKQLEIVKQHADQYSRLVKQGLGLANAELQLRLTEATQESELWRLEVQISRLQMDSGVLDLQIHEAEAIFKRQIITELRDVGERLKELDVVLPVAREIREVRLAQAGSLAGTVRSISVTRTRNGEVTSFQATETRPWSLATSSMLIGCFPAPCTTRALRPGNLVDKIIKCERQRQRDRLVWLPPSS